MKKYIMPIIMLVIFETVAVTLWLTKDNLFYLLNFSYIGCSIALGLTLYIKEYKYARRITQLLVGLYMLLYLGVICNENMQIEGFWYYLFTGVFEAATIRMDQIHCFYCIISVCFKSFLGSCRQFGKNNVLDICNRKCFVLCSGDNSCICF